MCASVAIKLAPKDLYPFFVPVDVDQRFVFNKNVGYFLSKYGYICWFLHFHKQRKDFSSLEELRYLLQTCMSGAGSIAARGYYDNNGCGDQWLKLGQSRWIGWSNLTYSYDSFCWTFLTRLMCPQHTMSQKPHISTRWISAASLWCASALELFTSLRKHEISPLGPLYPKYCLANRQQWRTKE